MSDLANLRVWDDAAIRGALSWYLDVAENKRPAKFRIAATVAAELDLDDSSEDALWAELDRLTAVFLARWAAIRAGAQLPPASRGPSLLELCRELAYRMLAHCNRAGSLRDDVSQDTLVLGDGDVQHRAHR